MDKDGKKRRPGCFVLLVIVVGLTASFIYAITHADEMGETPKGAIANEMGLSLEQAKIVADVLSSCGIDRIDAIQYDNTLDDMNQEGEKGYRITYKGIKNIILYISPDNQVSQIRWADNDLYSNKTVASTIDDYMLTEEEKTNYQLHCQEGVKAVLKAPSTAKFPLITEWKFAKTKEEIIVQSYVDAQNGFGATIRSDFQIIFTSDGNNISSFILDGEELMK